MPSHVGQARFSGCIAFTGWPRRDVEALLPPGLELAASPDDDGLHPVVFAFGEQADGGVLFGGFTLFTGASYQELGIAIPGVRHPGTRGLHNFVPRMYASYFPAVADGNNHYGYTKELCRLGWEGPIYVVSREDGRLILHADTEPAGPWRPAGSTDLPGFDAVQAFASQPMLGRRADGSWIVSAFDWSFDRARIRPVDCSVSVVAPLARGLPPRRYADVAPGSFEVRDMIWRVSWPSDAPVSREDRAGHRRRRSSPNARIRL